MHGHDLKPSHIAFESSTRVVRRPFLSLSLSFSALCLPFVSVSCSLCKRVLEQRLDKERREEGAWEGEGWIEHGDIVVKR